MPSEEYENLLEILKERFEANMHRHKNLKWKEIEEKLRDNPDHLHSLKQMEQTDGEPDVIRYDDQSDEYILQIVQKKAQKDAEVFAMIKLHLSLGRSINPITVHVN